MESLRSNEAARKDKMQNQRNRIAERRDKRVDSLKDQQNSPSLSALIVESFLPPPAFWLAENMT